jgi:hypothetical protein
MRLTWKHYNGFIKVGFITPLLSWMHQRVQILKIIQALQAGPCSTVLVACRRLQPSQVVL